jgi:hypothetical protein
MDSESIKIDFTVLADGYVLIFDEQKQKLIFVNPDEVLKKSVEDNTLPQDFIDKLDVDLDNKIDFDSGNFSN